MNFSKKKIVGLIKIMICSLFILTPIVSAQKPTLLDTGFSESSLDAELKSQVTNPMNVLQDSLQRRIKVEESESFIAEQQYYRQSLIHRGQSFSWQYTSSIIIFFLVIITVLCGLIYSGMQFYYSVQEIKLKKQLILKREMEKVEHSELPKIQDGNTQLEVTLSSIKISSSLIGVIILTISIAFFFLYLAYVYPIERLKIDAEKHPVERVK